MSFWIVICIITIILLIRAKRQEAARKAAEEEREAHIKELLSRLKSIDKNLLKIRGSLKGKGKEGEEKDETGTEGKNKSKTEFTEPPEGETA